MRSLVRLATTALLLAAVVSVHAAPLDGARQLIVVTSDGWDSTQGQLQAYVRDGKAGTRMARRSRWRLAAPAAHSLGLHPAQADGPQKQEGDGRSPAGIFALGSAFGYAVTRPGTALPYQPMLDSSYCMDVPASPFWPTASWTRRRSAAQRSRAPPSRCGWTCTTRATCATGKAS